MRWTTPFERVKANHLRFRPAENKFLVEKKRQRGGEKKSKKNKRHVGKKDQREKKEAATN